MKYNFISNTIFSKLVAMTLLLGGLLGCNMGMMPLSIFTVRWQMSAITERIREE